MTYLTVNALLETVEDGVTCIERILYIDQNSDNLVTIIVDKSKALPNWVAFSDVLAKLDEGSARLLKEDPWLAIPRDDAQLSESEKVGRDRAWAIIEPVVKSRPDMYKRKERGQLISQLVQSGAATKPTIYSHLCRYWQGGQTIHAIIPRFQNSGGAGKSRIASTGGQKRGRKSKVEKLTGRVVGINVDERIRKLLVKIGEEFYEDKLGITKRMAFEAGLRKYFHQGYDLLPDGTRVPVLPPPEELPTFEQFNYWYNKARDPDKTIISRQGQRAFNLKHRGMRGESTSMAYGPGSIYQIDATVGDVYLVSSRDPRLIIGRPVIYVVVDTFSRLVVGFTVDLEGPSWMGAVLAFENVATDKVEFCHSQGLDIRPDQWPSHHFPEAVLGDRGELEGGNADSLVKGFQVRVANTPPYRADWKAIVERRFRLINERIVHWLPGAVRRNERGDRDYRLDAAMTLAQLRKMLTICFLEHNQTAVIKEYPFDPDMRRMRVRANPLELWHWGCEHRTGLLRYFPPDVVRRGLLPRDKATMTARGLRYKDHYYTCDYIEQNGWRSKARQSGTWREDIAIDPWSSGQVWLEVPGQRELMVCDEVSGMGSTNNVPWAELELELALHDVQQQREETQQRQTRAQFDVQYQQIMDEAKALVASTPSAESKAQRLRGITENRQVEKLALRQDKAQSATPSTPIPRKKAVTVTKSIPMFESSVTSALDALVDDPQED